MPVEWRTISLSRKRRLCTLLVNRRQRDMPRYVRRCCSSGSLVLAPLILFGVPIAANAYSVLTHQELIDLSWESTIVPILRDHFPAITADELKSAHAYAYGGCVIQDLGYYPFGNELFSDLTHYVRTGDFVKSLFRNAHTPDELAFAIGALSHYIGDSIGHSMVVNRAVAMYFPKLRAKYGPSVNYTQDPHAHVQAEFAFEISQISKRRAPPAAYLQSIGLKVPVPHLAAAFYETYGLQIGQVEAHNRKALQTYRFGARTFVPDVAYAEAVLHHRSSPADADNPVEDSYKQRIAELSREDSWDRYRRKRAPFSIYVLAGVVVVSPKFGPLKMLSIKGPNTDTELLYVESVMFSSEGLAIRARQLAKTAGVVDKDGNESSAIIPDRDLDTGARVKPGGYPLTDKTYERLLEELVKTPDRPIPAELKQNIFWYYADATAPISTKKDPKRWASVQRALDVLKGIPERIEP
jgi:hypothetical protein